LLVHNTFSTENDIEKANAYFENLFFALCPNANLYIEDKLPDISMLCKEKQSLTIGTDSLASNHKLSVLDEMKTISQNFPEINFSEILKWATLNGAKALGFDNEIGSLEIGKSPGINLISNFDYKNLKLLKESKIKVIC
ncbi:MAG: amidohydrolase family protein, partial [Bacteroidales bacterium]|nr:amidohydrolase family protein [Bacteroidales bacterium]